MKISICMLKNSSLTKNYKELCCFQVGGRLLIHLNNDEILAKVSQLRRLF